MMRNFSVILAISALFVAIDGSTAASQVTDYYDDPVAYCSAAGEIERPGKHYTGPPVPDAIMAEVGEGEEERVVWGCQGGRVIWCYLLSTVPCTTDAQAFNPDHWQQIIQDDEESSVQATALNPAQWAIVSRNAAGPSYYLEYIYRGHSMKTLIYCNYAQSRADVNFYQFNDQAFSDLGQEEWVADLLQQIYSEAVPHCTPYGFVQPFTVGIYTGRDSVRASNSDGGNYWKINNPYKEYADEQSAKSSARSKFQSNFGVTNFVTLDNFAANPFIHKDKVVAIPMTLFRMLSENEAIFRSGEQLAFVDGLPSTQFTGADLALVAIVAHGTTETNALGNSLVIPYGTFVGAVVCQKEQCSDYLQ